MSPGLQGGCPRASPPWSHSWARRRGAGQMALGPGVDRANLLCAWQRALGAIASLGRTDLLSQEHILLLTRPRLQELSAGSPGPVTNKATKVGGSRGAEGG